MIRGIIFVMMVIAAVAVVNVYKREALMVAANVLNLKRQIAAEEEQISILKAEWSVMVQPHRLQNLVERYNHYLNLEPLKPEQIVEINDLPSKPLPFDPIESDHLGDFADRMNFH